MAANSERLAWAKVRPALLTHRHRPRTIFESSWRLNVWLISPGRVRRGLVFFVNVITWVMVTVLMDLISSTVDNSPTSAVSVGGH